MGTDKTAARPLHEIANDIRKDWKKVNYAAVPYLDAMSDLDSITDNYYADSARSVVSYFLSNASQWKGATAARIKAELKAMLGKRGLDESLAEVAKLVPEKKTALDESLAKMATWTEGEINWDDDPRKHPGEGSMIPSLDEKKAAEKPIGKGKNGYIAIFRSKRVEVMADTSFQAQQTAAEHFKARKPSDVTVMLAEKDGKSVTHSPAHLAAGDEKEGRYEEGKPADPTENMSPEDAKKWHEMNDEHGDKFKNARLQPKKYPVGMQVVVQANPASRMLYSWGLVPDGTTGTLVAMSIPGLGKTTYMPGPGGGLLYVDFGDLGVMGVSPRDLDKAGSREPLEAATMGTIGNPPDLNPQANSSASSLPTGSPSDEKESKFEEGKPADPTENMSPEDAKKWREEHEKNKDNFKQAKQESGMLKAAFTQESADFVEWAMNQPPMDQHDLIRVLHDAGISDIAPPKVKRVGPRFQKGDEVLIVESKHKNPATMDVYKEYDGKVGEVVGIDNQGATVKFKSGQPVLFPDAQSNRGVGIYKWTSPFTMEGSKGLEIIYVAAEAPRPERVVVVEQYLAGGKTVERKGAYYTGHAFMARFNQQGQVYFSLFPQQRMHVDPQGDKTEAGYDATSMNPSKGTLYYIGLEGKRPASWKKELEKLREGAAGGKAVMASDLEAAYFGKAANTCVCGKGVDDDNDGNCAACAGKTASAAGLYGFTKGVQADCETCIRKANKTAEKIARRLYGKDEQTAPFLSAHSRRANSLPAKILVAAMKGLGPKLASEDKTDEPTPDEDTITKEGSKTYGLYGFSARTANMGLHACAELRETAGHLASELHNRRADRHEHITGFFGNHSKEARCLYSRLLLGSYPDSEMARTASEEWLSWDD